MIFTSKNFRSRKAISITLFYQISTLIYKPLRCDLLGSLLYNKLMALLQNNYVFWS